MSFTNEQISQLLTSIQGSAGKRLATKLEKVVHLKESQFTFEKVMSILDPGNDKDSPKKPSNAWQLFLRDFRKGDQVEPGMNGSDIVAKASPIWKAMSEAEKKPYTDEANSLSQEYKKAKEASKPEKVDKGPSRPKNSWMLFLSEYRNKNKKEGVAGSAIVAEASAVWKGMSDAEKSPYESQAKALMEKFQMENKKDVVKVEVDDDVKDDVKDEVNDEVNDEVKVEKKAKVKQGLVKGQSRSWSADQKEKC